MVRFSGLVGWNLRNVPCSQLERKFLPHIHNPPRAKKTYPSLGSMNIPLYNSYFFSPFHYIPCSFLFTLREERRWLGWMKGIYASSFSASSLISRSRALASISGCNPVMFHHKYLSLSGLKILEVHLSIHVELRSYRGVRSFPLSDVLLKKFQIFCLHSHDLQYHMHQKHFSCVRKMYF